MTSRGVNQISCMPTKLRLFIAATCLICGAPTFLVLASFRPPVTFPYNQASLKSTASGFVVIYRNDFSGPVGSTFPEWTSSPISFNKTVTGVQGTIPTEKIFTVESPNHSQRFMGEFGGPPIGQPADPDWNRTRVEQTVSLCLQSLGPHTRVRVSFDLYVLKSWDGNSQKYGPDRFTVRITGGPLFLDTTFSNNPKVLEDGSYQSYPDWYGTGISHAPQTGAALIGTLGYNNFFKESVYHLSFTFDHAEPTIIVQFGSSLYEGKGTADESWGLDNVVVSTDGPESSCPPRR